MDDRGDEIRLLGISGSLRKGSWNTALLRAAAELAPGGARVGTFDLAEVPPYDQDRDDQAGGSDPPATVLELRRRIVAADAMVIASPEYNWSYSGTVKNAIDWCSRPGFKSILVGVPALLIGASGGPAGTGRAQLHLRQVLLSTRTPVLIDALQVANAAACFDDELCLTDPALRDQLADLLRLLCAEVERERGGRALPVGGA
ncbi:MAG TPA: NAD(P)H-dependent oxidoreductase [Solirubrobacterales bacterium]|jgi:chromate reductase